MELFQASLKINPLARPHRLHQEEKDEMVCILEQTIFLHGTTLGKRRLWQRENALKILLGGSDDHLQGLEHRHETVT